MGYLIESKKNWNFNISHEDVFLQVYSFLSTSKWLNTRELADRFHAGLAHSFRHCTICLWGIHRYTILYWSSYFTPSRTLQLLLEHTCAPQRFIPGEFRWCSSYCSLLRISIEDWIFVCAQNTHECPMAQSACPHPCWNFPLLWLCWLLADFKGLGIHHIPPRFVVLQRCFLNPYRPETQTFLID